MPLPSAPLVITLEYRVFGTCDGVTLAPPMSLSPSSPNYKAPDKGNIYRFDVDNLGVIPLNVQQLAGDASFGSQRNSFLTWALAYAPAVFPHAPTDPVLSLAALDVPGSGAVQLAGYADIQGVELGVYTTRCLAVDHGAALVVKHMSGGGIVTVPAVLRFRLTIPSNMEEYAMLQQACCCKEESVDRPLPIQDGNLVFVVQSVDPDSLFATVAPTNFTVSFAPGQEPNPAVTYDAWFVNDETGTTIQATVTQVTPTFIVQAALPETGTWSLTIFGQNTPTQTSIYVANAAVRVR